MAFETHSGIEKLPCLNCYIEVMHAVDEDITKAEVMYYYLNVPCSQDNGGWLHMGYKDQNPSFILIWKDRYGNVMPITQDQLRYQVEFGVVHWSTD